MKSSDEDRVRVSKSGLPVQRGRDKDAAKKQPEYLALWRQMSAEERESWRQAIAPPTAAASTSPSPAEPVVSDKDVKSIVAKFRNVSKTHADRIAHPDDRWEMYVALAQLVQPGYYRSAHACSKAEELQPLFIDRQKLTRTIEIVHPKLPAPPCPPSFRSGRSAHWQLNLQEKEELLQYIRFFAAHAMPLSVADVETLGGSLDCVFLSFFLSVLFVKATVRNVFQFRSWICLLSDA